MLVQWQDGLVVTKETSAISKILLPKQEGHILHYGADLLSQTPEPNAGHGAHSNSQAWDLAELFSNMGKEK